MSISSNNVFDKTENNLIQVILLKFTPYWPLFVILLMLSVAGAWTYIQRSTPFYEASASILFKDEKKGSDDSKISESLNYLSSKKIVENEIEVLHSKTLMREVVKNLHLYAPVYLENGGKAKIAYKASPISIELQNPDNITPVSKIPFSYNKSENYVLVDNKKYEVNNWVNTDYGTLKFIPNANAVVITQSYYFSLMDFKGAVQNYLGRLTVTPVSKLSSVVTIKLVDELPERAEDILNNLITSYKKVSNREKEDLASNTLSFVDERLKSVKHDLDSIEHKVQEYKSSGQATDIGQQGSLFLQNVSTNDQKLSEINMQLAVLDQVEKFALKGNGEGGIVPSTLGVSDPLLNQLLERLYQAEIEYEKIKKTTGENNPVLVSTRDEINKIKPSILQNIRSQRSSLEASKNNLAATNSSYSNIIQAIPKKERDLLEISREQAIKTNVYNFLLQKREETGFSNLPSSSDYRVIDNPDASLSPVSPNKKLIYLAAIAAALSLGIGFVVLKELLNKKISLRNDIESFTTLPIVAEISYKKRGKDNLLIDGKDAILSDQFQRIHTSFRYLGLNSTHKRILITSSISGEGKSFTASNLSLTLASSGKKVVLLEADLSNPSLYQTFTNKELKGISNFLQDQVTVEEIIKSTEFPNLSIIPAGTPTNNSSTLFMNGKIESLINFLDDKYDYIIIDSAPVGILTDAYILSPYCDATLYVVRQDYSPKEFVQRIINENNRLNKLKNLAIIFNAVQPKAFSADKYGYGYGYGYNATSKKSNSKWALKRG
jgi:tyrosine-protein kinase Etk/Wzc